MASAGHATPPASISVRCDRNRRIRSCMRLKAIAAARRTSERTFRLNRSAVAPHAERLRPRAPTGESPRTWIRRKKARDRRSAESTVPTDPDSRRHRAILAHRAACAEYRRIQDAVSVQLDAHQHVMQRLADVQFMVKGRLTLSWRRRLGEIVIHRAENVDLPCQSGTMLGAWIEASSVRSNCSCTHRRMICHLRSAGSGNCGRSDPALKAISPDTDAVSKPARDQMPRWLP